ncbi:MAG: PDZ domain-containing protein [Patescibacteria group bacterium]|jgi:hypothetical protein
MITAKRAFYAILVVLSFSACNKRPTENVPAEKPRASWIGVQLGTVTAQELAEAGITIAANTTAVMIVDVVPTTPADGVLKQNDILLKVGAEPATDSDRVTETIQKSPAGQAIEITVLRDNREMTVVLAPETKPLPTALLDRIYVGRPLAPLPSDDVEVFVLDGQGGIVPASKCVPRDGQTCPKLDHQSKQFALAAGKATILLSWAPCDQSTENTEFLAALKSWHDRYGAQGLEIVSLIQNSPCRLAECQKYIPLHPHMTLVYNYGPRLFHELTAPNVLVLDKQGVVRATAGTIAYLSAIANDVLPKLLGEPQQ